LAQFAGLADNRINKVVAFDSSPVTGARLLDEKLRKANAKGLEIDRVYQSTEILAWVRPFVQQFPAKSSPCVRTVIYDVFPSIGVVGMHSMNGLARGIVRVSYDKATGEQRAFQVPGKTARGCDRSYEPPTTDQDDYDEPGQLISSPRGFGGRVSRANPVRETVAYAYNSRLDFTSARTMEMDRSVVKLKGRKFPNGKQAYLPAALNTAALLQNEPRQAPF
jgi:hypothetical protein